jgi:hypothetical protein
MRAHAVLSTNTYMAQLLMDVLPSENFVTNCMFS